MPAPGAGRGNWKQWKWNPEMESRNGKQKQSKLDVSECYRVKPLINSIDHLCTKTTSVQRLQNYVPKIKDD